MRDRDIERIATRAGIAHAMGRRVRQAAARRAGHTARVARRRCMPDDRKASRLVPPLVVVDAAAPTFSIAAARGTDARAPRILNRATAAIVRCAIAANTHRARTRAAAGLSHARNRHARVVLAAAPPRCFSIADAASARPRNVGASRRNCMRCVAPAISAIGDFTALAQFAQSAAANPVRRPSRSAPCTRCFMPNADAVQSVQPVEPHVPQCAVCRSAGTRRRREFCDYCGKINSNRTSRQRDVDADRLAAIGGAASRVVRSGVRAIRRGEMPGAGDFAEFPSHEWRRTRTSCAVRNARRTRRPQAAVDFDAGAAVRRRTRRAHRVPQLPAVARGARSGVCTIAARSRDADRFHRRPRRRRRSERQRMLDASAATCCIGATIGAPPDVLNAIGQSWGLTTFSPAALRRHGFAAFLRILRAAMRFAGGVRLDHVMSLMRLWLVPDGARPVDGAYLRYPFDDLVRLVALESWRHRCIVIGEDLGTVPDDCRARSGEGRHPRTRRAAFHAPGRGIHSAETLARECGGDDLHARSRRRSPAGGPGAISTGGAGCICSAIATKRTNATNAMRSKAQLASALTRNRSRVSTRSANERVVDAAIDYVAASASPLAIVPIEDLLGARRSSRIFPAPSTNIRTGAAAIARRPRNCSIRRASQDDCGALAQRGKRS